MRTYGSGGTFEGGFNAGVGLARMQAEREEEARRLEFQREQQRQQHLIAVGQLAVQKANQEQHERQWKADKATTLQSTAHDMLASGATTEAVNAFTKAQAKVYGIDAPVYKPNDPATGGGYQEQIGELKAVVRPQPSTLTRMGATIGLSPQQSQAAMNAPAQAAMGLAAQAFGAPAFPQQAQPAIDPRMAAAIIAMRSGRRSDVDAIQADMNADEKARAAAEMLGIKIKGQNYRSELGAASRVKAASMYAAAQVRGRQIAATPGLLGQIVSTMSPDDRRYQTEVTGINNLLNTVERKLGDPKLKGPERAAAEKERASLMQRRDTTLETWGNSTEARPDVFQEYIGAATAMAGMGQPSMRTPGAPKKKPAPATAPTKKIVRILIKDGKKYNQYADGSITEQ